jgi:hypothetical protein
MQSYHKTPLVFTSIEGGLRSRLFALGVGLAALVGRLSGLRQHQLSQMLRRPALIASAAVTAVEECTYPIVMGFQSGTRSSSALTPRRSRATRSSTESSSPCWRLFPTTLIYYAVMLIFDGTVAARRARHPDRHPHRHGLRPH